jgi:hypothetical protein
MRESIREIAQQVNRSSALTPAGTDAAHIESGFDSTSPAP